MKSAVQLTTEIMKIGFDRSDAGTLARAIYASLKWNDVKFIELACRMFKDKRHNKWGDESGLIEELIAKYF